MEKDTFILKQKKINTDIDCLFMKYVNAFKYLYRSQINQQYSNVKNVSAKDQEANKEGVSKIGQNKLQLRQNSSQI